MGAVAMFPPGGHDVERLRTPSCCTHLHWIKPVWSQERLPSPINVKDRQELITDYSWTPSKGESGQWPEGAL